MKTDEETTENMSRRSLNPVCDGNKIRELRDARLWSNKMLADEAQVSVSVLERALAGKKPVKLDKVESIAKALGTKPENIFLDGEERVAGAASVENPPLMLKRLRSGPEFLNFVRVSNCQSVIASIKELASDLSSELAELMAEMVKYAEDYDLEDERPHSQQILLAARYNDILRKLESEKIGLFAGTFTFYSMRVSPDGGVVGYSKAVYDEDGDFLGYEGTSPDDPDAEQLLTESWFEIPKQYLALGFCQLKNEEVQKSIVVHRGFSETQRKRILQFCPVSEPSASKWYAREAKKSVPVWDEDPLEWPYPAEWNLEGEAEPGQ